MLSGGIPPFPSYRVDQQWDIAHFSLHTISLPLVSLHIVRDENTGTFDIMIKQLKPVSSFKYFAKITQQNARHDRRLCPSTLL